MPQSAWIRSLALVAIFLGGTNAVLRGQTEARLLFNGRALDPETGHALLTPGVMNRVAVEARPTGPWQVTVTLESAAGAARTETRTIEAEHPRAEVVLGPMAAPQAYDYEAGAVYQRGYRLSIRVKAQDGRSVAAWEFCQGHAPKAGTAQQGMGENDPSAQALRMVAGGPPREIYNPLYASLPPLSLRLDEQVLLSQDHLEVLARLNPGETPSAMDAALLITSGKNELARKALTLKRGAGWQRIPLDPTAWPAGDYQVTLQPFVEGKTWADAPAVTYRRRPADPLRVPLSPYAPWSLRRDAGRAEVRVTDFRAAAKQPAKNWKWTGGSPAGDGDYSGDPLALHFSLSGHYAVFVRFEGAGGFIQVGRHGLIRSVMPGGLGDDTFVEAADLTGDDILIHPSRDARTRLAALRLMPVTADSVRALDAEMRRPPLPMYAVNDWAEYFGVTWSRLLPDQFASIACGQSELGFQRIGWSVGRSWVEYHSKLAHARLFPCVPYDQARRSPDYPDDPYDYGPRIRMMNEYDPLASVNASRTGCSAEVWPWLAMQRHYSVAFYGGMFSCPFYRDHPQWRRVAKDGKPGGLSYFYPEVRKERVDILMEVAERGADGLVVGTDRQPPMALYEPDMVQPYRERTGVDPLKIDASSGAAYTGWIRFRAGFFTETLRELRSRLDPLRARTGKRIPVAVRLPSVGLLFNLAQGLDVEAWLREGLVQQIQLDPLEEFSGKGEHDVRPYLRLGRRFGTAIIAGIGSTAHSGTNRAVLTPGLRRARGLHLAGVDGIDSYETEMLAISSPVRFAVALYGHPDKLAAFLDESNLEAVYPIDAGTAAAGHDNHSVWRPGWGWDVTGYGGRSL